MTVRLSALSKQRFDALGGYCRLPQFHLYGKEVGWFQASNEDMLVATIRDHEDGDFAAVLFARDLKERYRFMELVGWFDTPNEALLATPEIIEKILGELDSERIQGDEKGKPVDFFTPVIREDKINKDFEKLRTLEEYSPALELIKPMMRWYEDADGNFVEQFQTTGFDTRFWELYLFAMLIEAGYSLDRDNAIPDFCARSPFYEMCIEATSVNPSRDGQGNVIPPPTLETEEQFDEFQKNYMPIRFAGPLVAKLGKKYWERPNVHGKPLILAIQDFHAPGSMTLSHTALAIYLYGMSWDGHQDNTGKLIITPTKVKNHQWNAKVVPSGFFSLPGAENISAVISNPGATISKFIRIGLLTGFGSKKVSLIRQGAAVNPDPNSLTPITFSREVKAPEYSETWMEGLNVYHNQNAKVPLLPSSLPGAAHYTILGNGLLQSLTPEGHVLASVTNIFVAK